MPSVRPSHARPRRSTYVSMTTKSNCLPSSLSSVSGSFPGSGFEVQVCSRTVQTPVSGQPNTLQQRGSRWLSGTAVSSAVMAYGLIIFGSQVRVSDSGMGCPDWPLCAGKLGPLQEFHALMEQTHRYLAAMVTVLVLTTAMLAWRNRARSVAIRPALFTVAVIVVQIGLGALTVIAGNGAPTVAAHLLAALAMLAGATITAVAA